MKYHFVLFMTGVICLLTGLTCVAQQDLDAALTQFNRAQEACQSGRYQEAVTGWSQALKLYQTIKGTERQQADCYYNLGFALNYLRKYDEAIGQYQQAYKLYQTLQGTQTQQANCYSNVGGALSQVTKYEEAITHQRWALKLYQTVPGTEFNQAICYENIGAALYNLKKYDEAIGQHQQAYKLYQAIQGTQSQQAKCYANVGLILRQLGKSEEAITHQRTALKLYQTLKGTELNQADCYQNLGVVLQGLGKNEEAIPQLQEALKLYQAVQGTERQQAGCYHNLSAALVNLRKYEEAMVPSQEALKLYQRFQDTERDQAGCYNNRGLALSNLGKYEEAMAQYEQALKLYQPLEDTQLVQADCCKAIGSVLFSMNKYRAAIQRFEEALIIYRSFDEGGYFSPTLFQQKTCRDNINLANQRMGKKPSPQQTGLIVNAQETQNAAITHFNRALKEYESKHYQKAVDGWRQALKLFQNFQDIMREQANKNTDAASGKGSKNKRVMAESDQLFERFKALQGTKIEQAGCYRNLGLALNDLGKHEEAMAQFWQALRLDLTPNKQADCYRFLGFALWRSSKYEKAMMRFQQALKIFQTLQGTERQQAFCYSNLGSVLDNLGKYEEALLQFQQALKLFQSLQGTEREQASCYLLLGVTLFNQRKYEETMTQYQRALQLFQSLQGAASEQADCFRNIGAALSSLGKHNQAMEKQEQALKIYQTLQGSERDQAGCYVNLGLALSSLGKHKEAMEKQEQALRIHQTLQGSERDQANCYSNLGDVLSNLRKLEEAVAKYRQALKLLQPIQGTERAQAKSYIALGAALWDLGKHEDAMAQYQQAMIICQICKGTEHVVANLCRNVGVALWNLRKHEEAIAQHQQALKIYQTLQGTEDDQAACYVNLGVVLNSLGKHEEAIDKHQQALKIYQALQGSERDQANCCVNLGSALDDLGKYEESTEQYQQALKLHKSLQGTELAQAACYSNLGVALWNLCKYEEAIVQQEQALKLLQVIQGTALYQSGCWGNIGCAQLGARRFSEAIAAFERAGEGDWICLRRGQAYRRRGQVGDQDRAIQQFLRASELSETYRSMMLAREHREGLFEQSAGALPELASLLTELAQARVAVQEPRVLRWAADRHSSSAGLEAAFHFSDQGKGRSLDDGLRERATLKAVRADTKLLAEDRDLSQQISKLTTMREQLPEAEVDRKKKLTQDIAELQQRRNMIEVELKKTTLGAYVAPEFRKPMEMAAELSSDTATLQYSVGEKETWLLILTRDGVTAHKLGCESFVLPELRPRQQATIAQLVEAWQKRPDKIGLDGLVRLARERAEDQGREVKQNLLDATQEQAILQRLGNTVLPTAALTELRQKKIHHLLVIPDGSLHYVPFAMLRIAAENSAPPRYLLEEFSVSYTPAMTTLETVRKQKKEREQKRKMERRHLLAFANPAYGPEGVPSLPAKMAGDDMVTRVRNIRHDYYAGSGLRLSSLPETKQEAMRVASLFGPPKEVSEATAVDPDATSLVLTSKAASEEQAKRLLSPQPSPRYRYVLFSTHGLADSQNGMLSCIALSAPTANSTEDGFLQAQEVLDLELDADLVMLSACQTGLGRLRGGEGLVGLSAAFFITGAESVCASLWQVPSGPTTQLVPEFFKNLKEGKMDRAEALRQAQLKVMRQGQSPDSKSADYSSPFCWAAFVLMGEHR